MYTINKIVGCLISPAGFSVILVAAAVLARVLGRKRMAGWAVVLALANFWFWASPATYRWLASGLESQFPVVTVEETPQADAIVVLGGGMGSNTNDYPYSEMWFGADRVWHGGRLYRAGKAPRVFVTNEADISLLLNLGVPRSAIDCESSARNTEEEAKYIASKDVKSVLLVTSAWHMRRAKLMFEKYAPEIEVVPAATDYEALVRCGWQTGLSWGDLLPDVEKLFLSSYMVHEIIGYYGYLWAR